MTKPDQQKLRILIGLLIVLAVTVFFGYRMSRMPNPAIVQAEDQKPAAATPPAQTDARIRLDLLKKESPDENLGKKNLFQYGPPPAPPAPPVSAGVRGGSPGSSKAPQVNPGLTTPPATASMQPPPPPPVPLKYIGVSFVEPNSKQLIATLIDDTQHHFNAVDGDIFMGRYRISRITESSVDVDDLQYKHHQTLQLAKQ